MSENRRVMALDHGEARIGVALSDPLGIVARPYRIIRRGSLAEDFALLGSIAADEQVAKIVVGLPTDSEGGIGRQAAKVIRWARKLARAIDLPVSFWDESYSSMDAAALQAAGSRRRRGRDARPAPIDDLAAATILQEYLDAGGAHDEPGRSFETLGGAG